MATTNDWAHVWLRIREFARVWNMMRITASSMAVAPTAFTWQVLETIITADKCVFDPDVNQGETIAVLAQRSLVVGLLTNGRSLLDPLMLQLSRAMGYPQTDPIAVFPILYRYMATNQGSFKSKPYITQRGFTRNAWSAGAANQGNGTVLRQTVDRYDLPLEADAPDVVKALCVQDANSGSNPGQEQFAISGLPFRDSLMRYAAGYSTGLGNQIPAPNLVGVTADNSRNYITNPSFAESTGSGATFASTGWTVVSGAFSTCSVDTAQYYRVSNVETAAGALKTTATIAIKQKIPANKFQAALCYMMQAACNFSAGGATGSVRMRLGTEATYLVDVTMNSGVGGWNTIRPTIDKKLYFANFSGTGDIYIRFDITISGGSYILLDDFSLDAFQNIGGKLLWAIGGATNWVVQDTGSITDTVPTTSGVPTSGFTQTMFAEIYGRSLPSYAPATAPAVPSIASAGGGTTAAGRYGVVITFYNGTTLLESKASTEVNIALTAGQQIALSVIPTGPGGTTDRYVYVVQKDDWNDVVNGFVSPGGPQSAYYFAAALGDNVATTKTFDPAAVIDLTKPLAVLQDI